MGIITAIEKIENEDKESQETSNTVLQFITNGMLDKKKYNLYFDLGEERNKELLNNKEEQEKFNNKLKKEIILTNPQKGSYQIQVIFQTNQFNDNYFDIK